MHFVIFSGSARQGNFTQHIAAVVQDVISQRPDTTVDVVSPASLNLTFNDEGEGACPPELKAKIKAADAFILVAPEYNHSYSGSLKFMLDLNLKEYIHKPVGFVGVSKGPWGGTRVIESLLHPVREMGMVATFTDVNVTHVQEEVKDGVLLDTEKWTPRINRMLDELFWMATVLKTGRESVPSQYHS